VAVEQDLSISFVGYSYKIALEKIIVLKIYRFVDKSLEIIGYFDVTLSVSIFWSLCFEHVD
jgi:hypothetical protein